MAQLTRLQREILLGVYALHGRRSQIEVVRDRGQHQVVITIGNKRLGSDRAVDALSDLYSRGLLHQKQLNRFVLTSAGRELAKSLLQSQN